MNDIEADFRSHFNEPVLVDGNLGIGRVIGYGEDDMDCYLIVRHIGGKVIWHTAVGGYYWMTVFKGQRPVVSSTGEHWDDYVRLDSLLALNGSPPADEFIVEIEVAPCPPLPA